MRCLVVWIAVLVCGRQLGVQWRCVDDEAAKHAPLWAPARTLTCLAGQRSKQRPNSAPSGTVVTAQHWCAQPGDIHFPNDACRSLQCLPSCPSGPHARRSPPLPPAHTRPTQHTTHCSALLPRHVGAALPELHACCPDCVPCACSYSLHGRIHADRMQELPARPTTYATAPARPQPQPNPMSNDAGRSPLRGAKHTRRR